VQFVEMTDMNGDGVNELAIFGRYTANNTPQIVVKDGITKAELGRYPFPAGWVNTSPIALDDITRDGVPEVGLYGEHPSNGKAYLFVRDGNDDTVKVDQYNWPNKWSQMSFHKIADLDGDGLSELALFGVDKETGRPHLNVKKGHTKQGLLTSYNWPETYTDVSFHIVSDQNGDGMPEYAVFGYDTEKARRRLMVKNGVNRSQMLRTYSWPENWAQPEFIELTDLTGDGLPELGVMGVNKQGITQVQIRNRVDGTLSGTYSWPKSLEQNQFQSLGDVNGDGTSDIGLFGVDRDTGLPTLVIQSGDNDAVHLKTYVWSEILH
jgi:hypothetical protein